MTPPREEFMAALERERDKRIKERTIKRAAGNRLYQCYKHDILEKMRRRGAKC